MILKFLLTAFLGTSFLGAESFASEEERLSLSLTGKQLKTGYELTVDGGFLELDDGSKWSVTNAYEWGTPSFEMFSYLFDETYGSSRTFDAYDWQKIGVFNFVYNEGMPPLRWNPETQQMEEDPNGPGFFEVFNLNVKRLVESSKNDNEKEIVINNKNTVTISSDTQTSSSITLIPKISISPKTVETIPLTVENNSKHIRIIQDFPFTGKTTQNFYVWQDPTTGLRFGVEKLREGEINAFWQQKIAYSTKFLFGKSQQEEQRRISEMSEEEIQSFQQSNLEFQQAMRSVIGGNVVNDLFSSRYRDVETLTSILSFMTLDEEFETLWKEKGPEYSSHESSYLDAFRAFRYNLNYPEHAWVAYVGLPSLEDGPLYKKEEPFTSKILMAKTFCLSTSLYSAMGIFKDPIAEVLYPDYKGLSMPLQRFVAQVIKDKINPDTQYLSFRPLTKMGEILTKSGIPFSSSWGNEEYVTHPENPYVRFKDNSIELYDQQEQTVYHINESEGHWFATNPFSAGVSIKNIKQYPFITVRIGDLLK